MCVVCGVCLVFNGLDSFVKGMMMMMISSHSHDEVGSHGFVEFLGTRKRGKLRNTRHPSNPLVLACVSVGLKITETLPTFSKPERKRKEKVEGK